MIKNVTNNTKIIAIIMNIIALLYFKYLNFGIANINNLFGMSIELRSIILPLGISFYTFQQIAYIVSVYREEISVGIVDYLTYILYFPKILMGPLMEPEDFLKQINDDRLKRLNTENIAFGIKVFSYGLLKKSFLRILFLRRCLGDTIIMKYSHRQIYY